MELPSWPRSTLSKNQESKNSVQNPGEQKHCMLSPCVSCGKPDTPHTNYSVQIILTTLSIARFADGSRFQAAANRLPVEARQVRREDRCMGTRRRIEAGTQHTTAEKVWKRHHQKSKDGCLFLQDQNQLWGLATKTVPSVKAGR